MKKLKNMVLTMISILALTLAGCEGESISLSNTKTSPLNLAFIAGIASGETKIITKNVSELDQVSSCPGSTYALIAAEGNPVLIKSGSIADLSDRGYTKKMMARIEEGVKADLNDQIEKYRPASPEIDMAAALELAVRQLNASSDGNHKNELVIYASGISTKGLINFASTPLYKIDIKSSVTSLKEKLNFDLSHVNSIVWYACGDTGNEQASLSNMEKKMMREFYQNLFVKLGMNADDIFFKDELPSDKSYSFDNAPVTVMQVKKSGSALKEPVILKTADTKLEEKSIIENPLIIQEDQIQFQPDSSEFADPAVSQKVIEPIVKVLEEHPEINIVIYGTTAGETNTEYSCSLSASRAESVRNILNVAGIESDRMKVLSLPSYQDDPYYKYGLGTGSQAAVNRKTVILNADSDLAKELLKKSGI